MPSIPAPARSVSTSSKVASPLVSRRSTAPSAVMVRRLASSVSATRKTCQPSGAERVVTGEMGYDVRCQTTHESHGPGFGPVEYPLEREPQQPPVQFSPFHVGSPSSDRNADVAVFMASASLTPTSNPRSRRRRSRIARFLCRSSLEIVMPGGAVSTWNP